MGRHYRLNASCAASRHTIATTPPPPVTVPTLPGTAGAMRRAAKPVLQAGLLLARQGAPLPYTCAPARLPPVCPANAAAAAATSRHSFASYTGFDPASPFAPRSTPANTVIRIVPQQMGGWMAGWLRGAGARVVAAECPSRSAGWRPAGGHAGAPHPRARLAPPQCSLHR